MLTITSAFRVHNEGCQSLFFYPDHSMLISATCEWDQEEQDLAGVLKVWSPIEGVIAARRDLDYAGYASLSPDGGLLVWGGPSGQFRLLDGFATNDLGTFQCHEIDGWTKTVFSPDGRTVVTSAGRGGVEPQGEVAVWDVASRRTVASLSTGWVMSQAMTPKGDRLAVGLVDGGVQIWDLTSHRKLSEFPGHNVQVKDIAFDPSGQFLVSAGMSESLKIWDLSTTPPREFLLSRGGKGAGVNVVTFLRTGELLTGDERGDIKLWDIRSNQVFATFSTNSAFADLEMVEEEDQITLQPAAAPEVTALALSVDGNQLAVGNVAGGVQLFAVRR